MSSRADVAERRQIQRDWLGHLAQAAGIVITIAVGLGLPLLYWGSGINTAVATLNARLERQEKDGIDYRTAQSIAANQMLEINKQLATIAAQLPDIRESLRGMRDDRAGRRR